MTLITLALMTALALGMTACEKKPSGTADSAGPSVKDAAQDAGEAVKDAGEAAGEAVGGAAKATGTAVTDAARATGKAVGNAAKDTGEFLTHSKDAAVKSARETLGSLEKKWQDLQAKAAPVTDEAKADFQKAKDQMAQILADARAKLAEAKDAGGDAWQQDVKPALDSALRKAQKLYDDAAAKFSSK